MSHALVRTLLLMVSLLMFALPEGSRADTVTRPAPGLTLTTRVNRSRGERLYVLQVDLCAAGVSVRATQPVQSPANRKETPFVTVPEWAGRVGVDAAINANFTCAGSCDQMAGIDGWVRGEGRDWGNADHNYVSPFAFGPGRVDNWHHNEVQRNDRPAWATQIISGHPTLVYEGRPRTVPASGDPMCTNRHPRTGIGFSADWRTLILAVVDGRDSPAAVGMTCNELRDLMIEFGAASAANLDGGGSSTLWVKGKGVLNKPSDGSSRRVAAHLGIFARGSGPAAHCMNPVAECAADPAAKGCSGTRTWSCRHGQREEVECGAGTTCTTADGPPRCVDPRCASGAGARCDGSRIVTCSLRPDGNYDVSTTDCAAQGSSCRDDGGARCGDVQCSGRPDGRFCADPGTVGACAAGRYAATSCPSGQSCADGVCIDTPCVGKTSAPFCADASSRGTCQDGRFSSSPCPDGQGCQLDAAGAAVCRDPRCDGDPAAAFCLESSAVARCVGGVVEMSLCAAPTQCSLQGGEARCLDLRCADGDDVWCSDGATQSSCRAGVFSTDTCGTDQSCVDIDGEAHCVDTPCVERPEVFCASRTTLARCTDGRYSATPCGDGLECRGAQCVEALTDTAASGSSGNGASDGCASSPASLLALGLLVARRRGKRG